MVSVHQVGMPYVPKTGAALIFRDCVHILAIGTEGPVSILQKRIMAIL